MAPQQLAAHQDAIHLDDALYARIDALYQQGASVWDWTSNRGDCWSDTTVFSPAPARQYRNTADVVRVVLRQRA